MIKKLLVFFLTIFTMTAYAQNVTMTGTVVDTDNLPLIGVNVVIKGTSTGTTTDLDGKFTLTGENGQTLVFSYIDDPPRDCLQGKTFARDNEG